MSLKTIQIEVMLLSWSDTASGGAKIVLQLADPDELDAFKQMTLAKKGHAGQRLMCVLVEIDPDTERPVQYPEQAVTTATTTLPVGTAGTPASTEAKPAKRNGHSHFPEGLCGLAVKWSQDADFVEWLWSEHGEEAYQVNEGLPDNAPLDALAGGTIKLLCNIVSRKELDSNEDAKAKFNVLIRVPYSAHRKEIGLA
jgi:hypothetical protein